MISHFFFEKHEKKVYKKKSKSNNFFSNFSNFEKLSHKIKFFFFYKILIAQIITNSCRFRNNMFRIFNTLDSLNHVQNIYSYIYIYIYIYI